MTRVLTDQQQKFLDVLFEEAAGDVVAAKKLAGYHEASSTSAILKSLADEVNEATRNYLARVAPRAAVSMHGVLLDPTQLGVRDKMAAAKDILDRTGFAKTEKVEVGGTGAIFYLPPKDKSDDD